LEEEGLFKSKSENEVYDRATWEYMMRSVEVEDKEI
jgi:hypothetical protein